jgi:hypothetical protein
VAANPVSREDIDRFHDAHTVSGLQARLWAAAFGEQYPAEVDPSSACTWAVLGQMVAGLRLRPDAMLVDLGCGRGGARAPSDGECSRLTALSRTQILITRSRPDSFACVPCRSHGEARRFTVTHMQ